MSEATTTHQQAANASSHYDADYFRWQQGLGQFGGWANVSVFEKSIRPHDTVIDFGCGGGFLLNTLQCARRIGIEPNLSAAQSLRQMKIEHFTNSLDALRALGEASVDVIISTNALEHTLNPLQEIKDLAPMLKPGGRIHFVVPCDSVGFRYRSNDINHHLFSWSPQNLGNLFQEAGYVIQYSKPFIHKWPPMYRHIARLGRPIFNLACRIYGQLERSWFQVEIVATKPSLNR
jgi:2-polyprenyl-3-methyl-5-hydroxy-6-metoxy-1,4-benzoquinol methylase